MIRITKNNIDTLRIGMYFLYQDIEVTRVYIIEGIMIVCDNDQPTFFRSNYYSTNGTFGEMDNVYYAAMSNNNYHILSEEEINYYSKLMVFK